MIKENLKTPTPKQEEIRCRLCDNLIFQQYSLKSKLDNLETVNNWYHCRCGCMFNTNNVSDKTKIFNVEYRKTYEEMKGVNILYDYFIRLYAPILEEKTYGRKFIDVGYCLEYLIDGMKRRGWISTGIDLIQGSYIHDDFEKFNFGKERFDLLWLGGVIQCFENPLEAIYKAYDLLRPDGLMFISTPNTDLIKYDFIPAWGHWDMQENRQFISEQNLRDILSRADRTLTGKCKIIYMDSEVITKRFPSWNVMHAIIQKKKIEMFNFGR